MSGTGDNCLFLALYECRWEQFHNPKDLAISLSIEASELLENFEWKSSPEAVQLKKDQIADELIYAVYLR
ncbi:hypothetical protein [Paenibacillus donghaensis]|uniref:Uncharacterized protein n=1 Tax=Paenibacillus donghaensis TaxID=414771 RepID=A0A2Z2KW07_9BACL|nr:hypothetical protein [Paenibacillus donghaensis]ASA26552.1 hypothetical protein B9T62_31560 [Paenibacillus donghaensis]